MELIEKLDLIRKYSGALTALFKIRSNMYADAHVDGSEEALASAVRDIVQDEFSESDGRLLCTDGTTFKMVWFPAPRNEWLDTDQIEHEKSNPEYALPEPKRV